MRQLHLYNSLFNEETLLPIALITCPAKLLLNFPVDMPEHAKDSLRLFSSIHDGIFACDRLTDAIEMPRHRVDDVLQIEIVGLWDLVFIW